MSNLLQYDINTHILL